ETFPFNKIKGKNVNTLIFPNLTAANCTGKMLLSMGIGSIIGPIQMGLKKPVYFTNSNSSEQEIYDLVAIAALDAITLDKK
ncbi:MAG: NADP-dependent malic enzyme, partial [Muribaculaceae bacterium]|nr:NADP-dependent malic enzyme [Muribaculaceae bacterium]